jgi:hypothetical protein
VGSLLPGAMISSSITSNRPAAPTGKPFHIFGNVESGNFQNAKGRGQCSKIPPKTGGISLYIVVSELVSEKM